MLRSRLGANAINDRTFIEPYWVGAARFDGGRMEIYDNGHALDQINVWFDVPVHRDDVLSSFGFPKISPTERGRGFFLWEHEFGIDRLHALRVPGTENVKQAMIEIL